MIIEYGNKTIKISGELTFIQLSFMQIQIL